jgi:hypothetical protein
VNKNFSKEFFFYDLTRNGVVKHRKIKCLDRWNFRTGTRIEISQHPHLIDAAMFIDFVTLKCKVLWLEPIVLDFSKIIKKNYNNVIKSLVCAYNNIFVMEVISLWLLLHSFWQLIKILNLQSISAYTVTVSLPVAQHEEGTRKAMFWSVTVYSKQLSSQYNSTAQIEPLQYKPKYYRATSWFVLTYNMISVDTRSHH